MQLILKVWCYTTEIKDQNTSHGPLTRYVKLPVTHAPGMTGTFSPPERLSDPDMHHGTCVTHVPWCMPGSLTSGFIWVGGGEKRSQHSWRMRNPQFYMSGKRPIILPSQETFGCLLCAPWRHWPGYINISGLHGSVDLEKVLHINLGSRLLKLPCQWLWQVKKDECGPRCPTSYGITRPHNVLSSKLNMILYDFTADTKATHQPWCGFYGNLGA